MNFKDGVNLDANNNKEPISLGSLKTYFINDEKNPLLIYWNSKNNEFEYVYDGHSTMWKSLKFKGIYGKIRTPKIVKKAYDDLILDKGL